VYRTRDLQCDLLVLFYETKRKSTLVGVMRCALCDFPWQINWCLTDFGKSEPMATMRFKNPKNWIIDDCGCPFKFFILYSLIYRLYKYNWRNTSYYIHRSISSGATLTFLVDNIVIGTNELLHFGLWFMMKIITDTLLI